MQVGIIGFGTLGGAIAAGLRAHPDVSRIASTRRGGDNPALASASDVIMLCVKPFQLEAVVREIAPCIRESTVVISSAAGVSLARLREWSGNRGIMVRAMPNTPCRVGEGMTVFAADGIDSERMELARSLFGALGRTAVIDERLMDAATAISGCGPAYVYLIIEALTDAGVKLGFSHGVALELVAQTVLGAARMVLQSDLHPAALKSSVATPAGCTVDGLMELEDGKLRSTLLRAVVAAAARSAELSPKSQNSVPLVKENFSSFTVGATSEYA